MPRLLLLGGQASPYIRSITSNLGPEWQISPFNLRDFNMTADAFHLHWPETHFRGGTLKQRVRTDLFWFTLRLTVRRIRRQGGRIVWTAHNLRPHEEPAPSMRRMSERQMDWLLRRVDVAVAMQKEQLPQLHEAFPQVPRERWSIVGHPHFRAIYQPRNRRRATREMLGIPQSAFVYATIGRLRPYKGAVEAIRAFKRTSDFLLLAGQPASSSFESQLQEEIAGAQNIRLVPRALSDEELADFYEASDAALCNYAEILNSGTALTALSMQRPVIVPRTPTFEALSRTVGPGWIHCFDGDIPLDRPALPNVPPQLDGLSGEEIAAKHRAIYLGGQPLPSHADMDSARA